MSICSQNNSLFYQIKRFGGGSGSLLISVMENYSGFVIDLSELVSSCCTQNIQYSIKFLPNY